MAQRVWRDRVGVKGRPQDVQVCWRTSLCSERGDQRDEGEGDDAGACRDARVEAATCDLELDGDAHRPAFAGRGARVRGRGDAHALVAQHAGFDLAVEPVERTAHSGVHRCALGVVSVDQLPVARVAQLAAETGVEHRNRDSEPQIRSGHALDLSMFNASTPWWPMKWAR